jgi:hypothetical protein
MGGFYIEIFSLSMDPTAMLNMGGFYIVIFSIS